MFELVHHHRLNENPSKKEGKCLLRGLNQGNGLLASMKALPNRKGNAGRCTRVSWDITASMKALPDRKGNLLLGAAGGFPLSPQ